MGCLRLTYREKEDRANFIGLWKKSDGSKKCNDYYPFGLTFNSYSRENSVGQDYKFGSKELQTELGLDVYDFEARFYDPSVGRAFQIDPLADKFNNWSGYSWTGDNPINNIDPDGRDWYQAMKDGKVDPNGAVMWQKGGAAVDGYSNIGTTWSQTM